MSQIFQVYEHLEYIWSLFLHKENEINKQIVVYYMFYKIPPWLTSNIYANYYNL